MLYQILPRYDFRFDPDNMRMFLKTLSTNIKKAKLTERIKSLVDMNHVLDYKFIIDCDNKNMIGFYLQVFNEQETDMVFNSLVNMFQEKADVFPCSQLLEKHTTFQTLFTNEDKITSADAKDKRKTLSTFSDDQVFFYILGSLKSKTRITIDFKIKRSYESKFNYRGVSTDVDADVMIQVSSKTKYQRNALLEITNTIINLTAAEKELRAIYKETYRISRFKGNELLNFLQIPTFLQKPAELQILKKIYKLEVGQRTLQSGEFSKGLRCGHVYHPMQDRAVFLNETQIRKHMFITGQTGSGKSSAAEEMMRNVLQRKASGDKYVPGFTFVDPAETSVLGVIDILLKIEADGIDISELKKKIHYIDFSSDDYIFPISILNKDVPSTDILDYFKALYGDMATIQVDRMMTNAINTLLLDDEEHTIMDIPKLFRDEKLRDELLLKLSHNIYAEDSVSFLKNKFSPNQVDPILNRTDPFMNTDQKKLMFGMRSKHDGMKHFKDWVDRGDIILFNISSLNDFDRKIIIGYILLKYYLIGLKRNDNSLLHITFLDESHKIQFAILQKWIAELRKSGMALCPMTQYLEQYNPDYLKALLGNVGTKISFRQGDDSARRLVSNLPGQIDREGLKRLPDCIGYVSSEDNKIMKSVLIEVDPPYRYNDGKPVPHPDIKGIATNKNLTKNRKLARELMQRDFISRAEAEKIVFGRKAKIEEELKIEKELLEVGDSLWDK